MRTLYVDAFSGISGNMFIGGLLDLGVPEKYLRDQLAKLPVSGYKLTVGKVSRRGVAATWAQVELDKTDGEHRRLADITAIVEKSSLDAPVKQKALKVFETLAKAEAKVHNISVEDVHFHEVGAVDTIVDVVGSALGLAWLGIEKILVGKVRTGRGFVSCAHGLMPVPAPATAELLQGRPFYQGDIEKELATPTGTAILAALAEVSVDLPEGFVSEKVGYGAGDYELEIPNALRLVQGVLAEKIKAGQLLVIETNIDDMNPQIYGHVINKLFAAGASDVWITPIMMKKNRPACLLSVLSQELLLDDIANTIFAETSTLGVRYYPVSRNILERYTRKVALPYGEVHMKYGQRDGKILNVSPEFEDCSKLSALTGRPIKEIWQAAMQADKAG